MHLPCHIVEWAVRQIENQINEMLKFGHEIKSGYDVIEIIRIICKNLFTIFQKDKYLSLNSVVNEKRDVVLNGHTYMQAVR